MSLFSVAGVSCCVELEFNWAANWLLRTTLGEVAWPWRSGPWLADLGNDLFEGLFLVKILLPPEEVLTGTPSEPTWVLKDWISTTVPPSSKNLDNERFRNFKG